MPKDNKVDVNCKRNVIYKVPCADCDKVYIGQTGNNFETRLNQHRSALRLVHPEKSALAEHAFKEDHQIDWRSAEIICREANYRKRLFLEAWHSKRQPCLNRCDLFVPSLYDELYNSKWLLLLTSLILRHFLIFDFVITCNYFRFSALLLLTLQYYYWLTDWLIDFWLIIPVNPGMCF